MEKANLLKKRIRSFQYAGAGIKDLLVGHPNAKIHLIFAVLVVAAGIFFSVSRMEWCLLVLCIALVFFAEAVNSAIEYWVDLVSPDQHPLAGKAKDMAAGAVLILAIGTVIVGCIIFVPKLLEWIGSF